MDFSDQVVAITGAAGNLGGALARAFSEAGANLALIDRTPERLKEILPDIAGETRHFIAPPTDVTDSQSVDATIQKIIERFHRIDILVNTAGGYRAGTPVHETSNADWDFMLNLNARSVFLTCKNVIPHMLKQGRGRIVNIASSAALSGSANHAAYSVSKTAVLRLTESMAAELKSAGINVNCVLPGIIDTPPNRKAMPDADYKTWVTPESIAGVILFLSSDAASDIHGAAIPVFGKG
ncbi:MAG: SDR family oxidoreductase [Acidobacteria bacterium]|nr:SDR family oxidoreductase [Acidobacteriota bacterium]